MYVVKIENQWTGHAVAAYGPYDLQQAEAVAADYRARLAADSQLEARVVEMPAQAIFRGEAVR